MATANALIKETPSEAAPQSAKWAQVSSEDLTLEYAGQTTRQWTVWLPYGLTQEDAVKAPIWQRVQASEKYLRPRDKLEFVAGDRTWTLRAQVAHAGFNSDVTFFPAERVQAWPARARPYAMLNGYEVAPWQDKWIVRKIGDTKKYSGPHETEADAEGALRTLVPHTVFR